MQVNNQTTPQTLSQSSNDLKTFCVFVNFARSYNRTPFIEAVKMLGYWWFCNENIIVTKSQKLDAIQLRDYLRAFIHEDDAIMVMEFNDWAGCGFEENIYNWLNCKPSA